MFFGTYPRDIGQAISPIDELFTYGHAVMSQDIGDSFVSRHR